MNINKILNEEKSKLLNESGIKIPKGIKAAKILFHRDMDGVFSAILIYRQLIKQGIKPKHIRLEGIQYGDKNPELERKFKKKKGQMIALVDFARIPEGKEKQIDFWSDHHVSKESKKKQRWW